MAWMPGAQAADPAAAEQVHGLMVAAGVQGNERTYNMMVKAFAYAAERAAPAGGRETLAAVSRSSGGLSDDGAGAAWDLQQARPPKLSACYKSCQCRIWHWVVMKS